MSEDLAGFKPNMYRLMQISGKALELAINYTSLFHTKRNRVEIISDFPDGNDAEVKRHLHLIRELHDQLLAGAVQSEAAPPGLGCLV